MFWKTMSLKKQKFDIASQGNAANILVKNS